VKHLRLMVLFALIASSVGCASYSGVARVSKSKVVVLKNDQLLFGLLRKALVCDVSASGLSNCQENEQP